mmetsp:Transcript_83893/g.219137  ORF Transcript_83893/g.219137 Transcript_83893/m.219137 type:complete len:274 (+) Transcript_83893:273-1094(+)
MVPCGSGEWSTSIQRSHAPFRTRANCTAAMSLSRCFSGNFVGGKLGWCLTCLERFPAPTWQPSIGTLNSSPSSVRIVSPETWSEPAPLMRSSNVHWWHTKRSPLCTSSNWYFGQIRYVGDMRLPAGMMQVRHGCALEGVKMQWNGATVTPGTSTTMVFLRSDPKVQGSCGRPLRPVREMWRPSCAKKDVNVDPESGDASSEGNSTSDREKESDACGLFSASTPGSPSEAPRCSSRRVLAARAISGLVRQQAVAGWLPPQAASTVSGRSISTRT